MKLYISDLDGTLLNNNMMLSEETVEIINSLLEQGLNFTFATARSMDSVEKIINPLKLKLPFIIYNGGAVYDPIKESYIRKNTLDKQRAKDIIKNVEHLNPFVYIHNEEDRNFIYYKKLINEGQRNFTNAPVNKGDERFRTIKDYDDLDFEEYFSIACIDKKENLEEIYNVYKNEKDLQIHLTEDVYQKEYYWLEFAKIGSSKKDALLFLKEYLDAKKLITFGDNLNDISMFTIADETYAVDNAHIDLKKIATEIIESNVSNAVARKIRKDFLK